MAILKLSHLERVSAQRRVRSLSGVNLLRCGTKKCVAFLQIRAHSDFTATRFLFVVSVFAIEDGKIFKPSALEVIYEFDDQRSPS